MPLDKHHSKAAFTRNLRRLLAEGYPHAQALAIAYRTIGEVPSTKARKKKKDLP